MCLCFISLAFLLSSCSKYEKPSVVEFDFWDGHWTSSRVSKDFNSKKNVFQISAVYKKYAGSDEFFSISISVFGDTAGTYVQSLGQCDIFFEGPFFNQEAIVTIEEPFSKGSFEAEFYVFYEDTVLVRKITDGVFR